MRTPSLVAFLGSVALAVPHLAAAAEDEERGCDIEITDRDEVIRSGDIVVGPGERLREVVALSGSVRVKTGATVEDVVALGGQVIVEDGAVVTGDATAVGGDVRLQKGARVEGSATTVGGKLQVAEGALLKGDRNSVQAELEGKSLEQHVLSAVSSALKDAGCRIRIHQD